MGFPEVSEGVQGVVVVVCVVYINEGESVMLGFDFYGSDVIGVDRDLCDGFSGEFCTYQDDGSGGGRVVVSAGSGVDNIPF